MYIVFSGCFFRFRLGVVALLWLTDHDGGVAGRLRTLHNNLPHLSFMTAFYEKLAAVALLIIS